MTPGVVAGAAAPRGERVMSARGNYTFDLDEWVSRTPVSYKNRYGITMSADVYRLKDAEQSQRQAAIAIGPPYGGVEEQGPGSYAQNMALRGFTALTFDQPVRGPGADRGDRHVRQWRL